MTPTTEYREIPLTKGQSAIVDAADFDWLMQWKWNAKWAKSTQSFYACRIECIDGKRITVRMHRFILGLHYGDERHGDHENRNTLDNRRGNLRATTRAVNNINQGVRKDNVSGVRGVYWYPRGRKHWRAQININGTQTHLGSFDTVEEAKLAYDGAEATHYAGMRIDTMRKALASDPQPTF